MLSSAKIWQSAWIKRGTHWCDWWQCSYTRPNKHYSFFTPKALKEIAVMDWNVYNSALPCWAINILPIIESSKLKASFIKRYLIDSKDFPRQLAFKKVRCMYFRFSGYFNTRPEPPSYPNPQQVAPRPPPTTGEEANTSDDDCGLNYICFDCSDDYKWYDLRGKGM